MVSSAWTNEPHTANDAATTNFPRKTWTSTNAYRFRIQITKEEDGSFSAIVMNLPGIGSCGSTEEETMANVREAIVAAMEAYNASHAPIPWKVITSVQIPYGAKQKWIVLDA
jgi:predicted RNase H-like HicB family nuclease